MTCEDVPKKLIENMLGLLSPEDREELERHAKSCPACAERMEKIRMVRSAIADKETIPPPDWEVSWQVIAEKTLRKKRRFAFPMFRYHWALAVGLASIFILGAIAGKVIFFKPKPAPISDIFAGMNAESAWRSYADSIELLLVDFGNRAEVDRPRNIKKREKELVGRLLAETRVLKELLAQERDDARIALLNDVELILVGIANLKPGDKESAENIAKIVREGPLKSRLRTILSSDIIL